MNFEERFRQEAGGGAVVLIGIVDPVRVELEPLIIPVEVRRVREVAIGVQIYCPCPS